MDKGALRKVFKEKRRALSAETRALMSQAVCDTAIDQITPDQRFIHCFLPIERLYEVDTYPLVDFVIKESSKTLVCSISDFNTNELQHMIVESLHDLSVNQWGIPEPTAGTNVSPSQIDLVFVPLLACDKRGSRLGYGKGFYDRFLAKLPPKASITALSFFPPLTDMIPASGHDIAIHRLITPPAIYRF